MPVCTVIMVKLVTMQPKSILQDLFICPIKLVYSLAFPQDLEGWCVLKIACLLMHIIDLGYDEFQLGELQQTGLMLTRSLTMGPEELNARAS